MPSLEEVRAVAKVLLKADGLPMKRNGISYFEMALMTARYALEAAEKVRQVGASNAKP